MVEPRAATADDGPFGLGVPHAGKARSAAETGRSEPYQDNSPPGLPVWQCFEDWLPARPYCTNDPAYGLGVRGRQLALRRAFLQLNTPHTYRWLSFDIDRPGAAFADEDANVAPPNVAVTNPDNGHAHLLYALRDPVHATFAARQAPLRYLADIELGMRRRLGADPGYTGLIAKNPLSRRWFARWAAPFPYTLEQLDRHLTRRDKRRISRCTEEIGLGRNCALFDALRRQAYRDIRDYKRLGANQRHFQAHLEDLANELNHIYYGSPTGPLGYGELRAIAKSVAKFCFRHMSPGRFSAIQRHRAEARTRRHLRLIQALKHGDGP